MIQEGAVHKYSREFPASEKFPPNPGSDTHLQDYREL